MYLNRRVFVMKSHMLSPLYTVYSRLLKIVLVVIFFLSTSDEVSDFIYCMCMKMSFTILIVSIRTDKTEQNCRTRSDVTQSSV